LRPPEAVRQFKRSAQILLTLQEESLHISSTHSIEGKTLDTYKTALLPTFLADRPIAACPPTPNWRTNEPKLPLRSTIHATSGPKARPRYHRVGPAAPCKKRIHCVIAILLYPNVNFWPILSASLHATTGVPVGIPSPTGSERTSLKSGYAALRCGKGAWDIG
jgi:hypothetical protein